LPNRLKLPERSFHLDYGRRKLAELREEGVRRVEVITAGDWNVCDECATLGGKVFDIDRVPLLPIHEERAVIVVDDDEGEIEAEVPICRCIYLARTE
jgi:hypothetical protein